MDGDACPVKAEVERVATRHGLAVTIVSNGGLRPSANPLLRHVIVAEGADAADNWIVDNIAGGDICITADIPLAARCLDKGAAVLAPNGKAFTHDSIGMALGMRDLSRHLRELTPGGQTHHAGFSKQDRSRFLGALENCITALQRAPRAKANDRPVGIAAARYTEE
ncbi:MAG TPA: YaiI/YqxD family protein [Rhizomicrobium sp.]|nr:YaiI/YqxD family protein [Rhizomicrobium sp.]